MATYQEQLAKLQEKKNAQLDGDKLSANQINNWRIILRNLGVPFAETMPDFMVQKLRDVIAGKIGESK